MEIDKQQEEAFDKADEFCKKLSFEFYWDFPEVDRKLLRETISICFAEGYLDYN